MAVELDTAGPGVETYRSTRFAASVNGTAQHVYGWTQDAGFTCETMTAGDPYQVSWLKIGTSESVTVRLELADETPITSVTVYPRNVAQGVSIASGAVTMIVPANKRLWVEVNGERGEPLLIFSEPVKEAVPGTTTNWTTLGKEIASIDFVTSRITFTANHGWTTGDRVILQPIGAATNTDTETLGLTPYEPYLVDVIDADTVVLMTPTSEPISLLDAGGLETFRVTKTSYTNTSSALYFGAGVHHIGRDFRLAANVQVYLDRGAIVVGGFRVVDLPGVQIKGPGQISGEFATYAATVGLGFAARTEYALVNGYGDADGYNTCTVQGVTMFAAPFFHTTGGAWSWRNVQLVSPWDYNTDGFITTPRSSSNPDTEVLDCFAFVGDDNVHVLGGAVNRLVRGCFLVNTSSSVFHFGYWPYGASLDYGIEIDDCDAMSVDSGSSAIFRAWMDGWATQGSFGVFNVAVTDVRVWGPLAVKVFEFTNTLYPFDPLLARDRRGQFAYATFDRVWVEETEPGELSQIQGYDAVSTPHDLTFTDVTIGGVLLTEANAGQYIEFNQYVYDIQYGTAESPAGGTTFVAEDGTGLEDANSYCEVSYADDYFTLYGSPSAWTGSTTAQKEMALRVATAYLEERYQGRWKGQVLRDAQALSHPRANVLDQEGRQVSSAAVHRRVLEACCEVALRYREGVDLRPDAGPGEDGIGQSSITVGPVSITDTFRGASTTQPDFPVVAQKLRPLLSAGGSRLLVGITR